MGMQTMNGAPARMSASSATPRMSAGAKSSKVAPKAIGEVASAKSMGKAAPTPGMGEAHFGDASKITGSLGRAPVAKGPGVQGFTSTGLMNGKV